MKRFVPFVLVMCLAAVPFAFAGKGDASAGKAVFAKTCAVCHGANGEGKEAIAKALKATIRHLGSKEVQAKSDGEIRTVISKGSGKMKPVNLGSADVDNVIAFVRTVKQ